MRGITLCIAAALLLTVSLTGCAATRRAPDGIIFRSENWYLAAEQGFVVAPVLGVRVVTDPSEVSASFTNEFHLAVITAMPGTPLVSPEKALHMLDTGGEEAQERFRSLRMQLLRGELPPAGELTAIGMDLQHRYLLVGWMIEGVDEGIQQVQYDDYGTVNNSIDVRRFTYEQVNGRATAVVLDLWEAEELWRGIVDYETARLYGEDGGIRRELDRTRAAAAVRLADYLGQL